MKSSVTAISYSDLLTEILNWRMSIANFSAKDTDLTTGNIDIIHFRKILSMCVN